MQITVLILLLPIVIVLFFMDLRRRQHLKAAGVRCAHEIACSEGWVSPYRLKNRVGMAKADAMYVLRTAVERGLLYRGKDGRFYPAKPIAVKTEAISDRPDVLSDTKLVERCIALAVKNALLNDGISAAALETIGVSRFDAGKILAIAVERGDLALEDGIYKPSAALRSRSGKRRQHRETAPKRSDEYANALATLGVKEGAQRDDVEATWKEHLKRNHPDVGGSTRLAQEINNAWDIVRRHRGWD